MRKSKPKKRILLPDPKYHEVLVTQFVNNLMLQGKKSIAYLIFYDAIDMVGEKMKDSDKAPLDIWKKALENITPQVEVKSRRVGGANFQVPMEVRPDRKVSLALKNMVLFARKRSGHSMAEKLSAEIIAAYNNEGAAYKRKEDMHRMAEANKAFAHFRF
ncbi:MAG: 30S ribosomal protein S7 [Bacteroidales bacterium]